MKKKILFIGASGPVADILIPFLSKEYELVGISATRTSHSPLCVEYIRTDLLRTGEDTLKDVFSRHTFDAVIWNAVQYFINPLAKATRVTLHTEFDLAVALPLTCAHLYLTQPAPADKRFISISSQSAFGARPNLATYSIVKRGQLMLMEYLAQEYREAQFYALLPGSIKKTDPSKVQEALSMCLTTQTQTNIGIKVEQEM